ncbi:MAG: carboxypeptidase regulatory-like domain-containing protein [Coriobacteriales bacterium]|jgi:Fe-S-cluster-containing dehydrogenase component|nr:carboxypeptidase regulatory-like domain-containing protein [Coriobacteriales bacterium]
MSKVFVVNVGRCNGCHTCQVACKDEHCKQPWPPYANAQPLTGQFWLKVKEKERGQVPWVRVSYIPTLCNHCADAPCVNLAGEAVYRREDGLVIIDPTKASGLKDLVAACPIGAIFYNDELDLPQKCTGCAHLLDNGWEVPRCVDACPTDALLYVEESTVDVSAAMTLPELEGLGPRVYYQNYPKRFVAGCVVDAEIEEVIIGAHVSLLNAGGEVSSLQTDDFGDFKFDQVDADDYTIKITADGYAELSVAADVTNIDRSLDDIVLISTVGTHEVPGAGASAEARASFTKPLEVTTAATTKKRAMTGVICPECGKKIAASSLEELSLCQFCKADFSRYTPEQLGVEC